MAKDNPAFPIGTAVTGWTDSTGEVSLRVYSSDGYMVKERCQTGDDAWYDGNFNKPGNQVSAFSWVAKDGVHIRVYCTLQDKTTEWCYDPATLWTQGTYTTV